MSPQAQPAGSKFLAGLHQRRERFKRRNPLYRALFVVAGIAVTGIGIITLVTPGPAFVIIPLGLSMLALQFDWAERLLVRVVKYAEHTTQQAAGMGRTERILTLVFALVLVAAVGAVIYFFDIPLLPF